MKDTHTHLSPLILDEITMTESGKEIIRKALANIANEVYENQGLKLDPVDILRGGELNLYAANDGNLIVFFTHNVFQIFLEVVIYADQWNYRAGISPSTTKTQ